MIQVRLRVVGIFYDQMLGLRVGGNIKDLLDVAVVNAGMTGELSNFSYTSTIKEKLENGAAISYNSLLGFTHNLTDRIEPSLGAKKRESGYYKLFESTSVEKDSVTVHAWQYYVIRADKDTPKSKTVLSNFWDGKANFPDVSPAVPNTKEGIPGFKPFDKLILDNGDEVVWRNVSIVRNPQTPPIY